jgi:hypothetical protein
VQSSPCGLSRFCPSAPQGLLSLLVAMVRSYPDFQTQSSVSVKILILGNYFVDRLVSDGQNLSAMEHLRYVVTTIDKPLLTWVI